MPSQNLHKLISAFLAIAVVASSSAFGVSYWRSHQTAKVAQQNGASVPGNAFVEALPEGDGYTVLPVAQSNATEGLAEALAAQIIADNPEGPTSEDGEMKINLPANVDGMLAEYLSAHPISEDVFPELEVKDVRTVQDDRRATEAYLAGLSEAVSSFQIPSLAGQPEDQIVALKEDFEGSLNALRDLKVPESASEIHLEILTLFSASENYFDLILRDPVAAAALLTEFQKYNQQHVAQLDKILDLQVGSKTDPRGAIARMLRLKVAQATLPTIDYVHIGQAIVKFLQSAWEIAQEVLMEYAKNYLLREMSRQVVNWILGNGEPQFITNWEGFFRNAADEVVGAVIQEAAPNLCGAGLSGYLGNMSAIVQGLMKPIDIGAQRTYPGCTLTDVIQNVDDFRNDIRNGGWLGYGSVFEPQNTFFGQVLSLGQRTAQSLVQRREALVHKVEQGFKPVETCEDGKPPSAGGGCDRTTSGKGDSSGGDGGKADSGGGGKGDSIGGGDGGKATEPQITAPANIPANTTARSFDAAYDRIVATSGKAGWAAMGAFILDAMISKLVTSGIKGLGGSVNQQYIDSGGSELPSLTVEGRTEQMLKFKNQSLSYARAAQTSMSQVVSTMSQIEKACVAQPDLVTDIKLQQSAVIATRNETAEDIVRIGEDIDRIEEFQDLIKSERFTIKDLERLAGTFESAKAEMQKFGKLRTDAEDALQGASRTLSECDPDAGSFVPTDNSTSTDSGGF